MYEAYLNDDPSLLKANCNINIDIKESELDKIWYEGKGKVCYKYNIVRCVSDDGSQGVRIEGDTDIFLPKLKWFEQQQDQEKLFIREETDETGPKLFIGKNPNIRTISVDDIEEHAIKACRDCTTYSLNVTNGTQAFRIPLREWIKITYENYLTLVDKQKQQKIQDVEFNIKVAENTEAVANYIINRMDSGTIIEMNYPTDNTVTIPNDPTFPINGVIMLRQMGVGTTTVIAGSGITLRNPHGTAKLYGQYASAFLQKRGTSEWCLEGNLSEV
jgi:hypothetical protein